MNRVVNYSAGEKLEAQIPLSDIQTSQNPRQELRGVLELFHEKGASHNSPESRAEFVAYIDKNFSYIRDRAESFKVHKQIQAVTLRRYDSKGKDKYGIVVGECRVLAWGLIEAETGEPQKVRAVIAPKMTKDEAFDLGIAENLERQDMSPIDLSLTINEMLTERINPATTKPTLSDGSVNPLYDPALPNGRPYTLKEIAAKIRKDYHWVRGRAALIHLSERDQLQVNANFHAGKRDLTRYITKAFKLAQEKEDAAKTEVTNSSVDTATVVDTSSQNVENVQNSQEIGVGNTENSDIVVVVQPEQRRRVKPLKVVLEMFDATPAKNTERLQALADVMGIELSVALAEREQRLAKKDLAEARQVDEALQKSA